MEPIRPIQTNKLHFSGPSELGSLSHQDIITIREQAIMTFIQALFRTIERSKLKMGVVEMTGFAAIIASIIITLAAVSFVPGLLLGETSSHTATGSSFIEHR
jgi:hypothetical protein